MKRREFVGRGLGALVAGSLVNSSVVAEERAGGGVGPGSAERELLRELVRANDEQIPGLVAKQERGAEHPARGGFVNEYGIFAPGTAAGAVSALACAVAAADSRYFRSAELVGPLRAAIGYLRRTQHDDGTIDYFATNFRSPPDLAFVVELLSPACALLRASAEPALRTAGDELGAFIVKGGEALVTGGVHTPNHRWVVCAALGWVNALYPDARYVRRAEEWLAEGIDIDPDGQYTEKSTTVYSPIVDRALITVARLLGRNDVLEAVRRNLEMTLYYVHPDGEVVTEASRRQDRYQRGSMARYYYAYRAMALRDGNGRFAAMTRAIERQARDQLRGELATFLTEPELLRPLSPDAPLPTDYAKVFAHSQLARIRRGARSGTVLAGNTTLFSLRKGMAALEAVRVASAFFGKGQFAAETLTPQAGGGYVLRQTLEGPYFQPLSREQIADGEHVRMAPNGTLAADSRTRRKQSNICRLEAQVEVVEIAGAFELRFDFHGTDHVPVAIELAFRHGGKLEGVEPMVGIKDAFLLGAGCGRYAVGEDRIEFGAGRAEHRYVQVRGALPKWDGQSVFITGFTPFRYTLRLT